ncbi:lysophospholipid acyltransferase family protein [soil metagenome]
MARSGKTPVFRVLAFLVIPFMRLIGKYEISGASNVPATGSFVIAPNHFSNIDPLVVGLCVWKIDRAPRYLAKASLFRVPVLGWFMRKTGQVPVERSGTSRVDPLKQAREIAASGEGVIVYPEGSLTRDPDFWPMRGKSGAVRIALEGDLPLIPAAHWGDLALMGLDNKLHVFPLRKRVRVTFGEPVDLSAYRGKPLNSALLTAATNTVMQAITALVEQLRGETAPAERWDPVAHGQSEIGRIEQA